MRVHKGWAVFWASVLIVLGVVDVVRDRHDDGSTFSEGTRWVYRVDTSGGRATFIATLAGGALAFGAHILKKEARP